MNYWWVNHNQTSRQEFGGKYIWCPKRKRNDQVNHFYETAREVKPGDLILSYASAALQGFGFATTHYYSCPKPDEFGKVGDAWDRKGWRESNNEERITAGNGLLLTPSIHHLFDRGFISLKDNGELIKSPISDNRFLTRMGINTNRVVNVGQFNIDKKQFLSFHRQEIFLKSAS